MHHLLHPSRLFSFILLLLAASFTPAQQTHLVPQDFPTVQAAIDASADGDTVLVAPGTYVENLALTGKSISLLSSGGAATTVLDGAQHGPVLSIAGSATAGSVVSGFTIQEGLAVSSSHAAAGIALSNTAATLASNRLRNNSGDNIGIFFGAATVRDSTLSTAPSTFGNGCDGGNGITVTGSSTVHDAAGNSIPLSITGNSIAGDSTACSGTGIALTTDSFTVPHLVANNTIRDSLLGLRLAVADGILLQQNLIFDNLRGAAILSAPATPSTDPAQTLFLNNTVVNNLNAPDPTDPAPAEVRLLGTSATTAFRNTILVGTTAHPVLFCEADTPSLNTTPLLLDHTDVFNTTQTPTGLLAGDCTPGLPNPLARSGNLSVDPALAGSTDLHLTAGSPALDAGLNAAPLPAKDLDGHPRVLDATARGYATIDLGAYEFPGVADATAATVTLTASTYLTPATTLTLTAGVSNPDGTVPAGTLTFVQNGTPLATLRPDSTGAATLQAPLTTAGLYAIVANFTPDAATPPVAPTASPVLFVEVTTTAASSSTPTALTLTPSAATLTVAETLHLQLHLASVPAGATVPPGSITLTDNGAALSTITPSAVSGDATVFTTLPTTGLHTLVASYPGSSSFGASSAATTVTVTALLPTTLSLASSPAIPAPGQTVTLTAHLGSTTASGSVGPVPPGAIALYDGTTLLTSLQPDAAGLVTYTLPVTTAAAGPHTFSVRYAGTTVYGPASSSAIVTLVAAAATTLAFTASPATAFPGATVTLVAILVNTASPATTPTGMVTFTDRATTLGTAPVIGGTATLSLATLTLGTHPLTATYAPDPAFAGAHASTNITVAAIPTSLTLASSLNPATATSTSLSLTATVALTPAPNLLSSAPAAPTGTITLSDGTASLGSLAVVPVPGTPTGSVTFPLHLAAGSHTLVATFQPASPTLLGSSATLAQVMVSPATPAISLVASPNPAAPTEPITFTITVANAPAQSQVQLRDGASPFATQAAPQPSGKLVVTATPNQFAPGDHALSATLLSGTDLLATSAATLLHINGLQSAVTLTAAPSPTVLATAPVTLSVTVSAPAVPDHTLSGSVTFRDGSTILGTAPLGATGHVAFTTSALAPGPHLLSATYAGDSLVSPASSSPLTETVTLNATSISLTSSTAATTAFQPVILTAHVTSPSSTPPNTAVCTPACTPTTVTFLSGTTILGTAPLDATGHASLALAPHAGSMAVIATFSGSPLFTPSTSTPVTFTVAPAPTTLSLSASPNPLFQNNTTTLSVALAASLPSTVALPALSSPITLSAGDATLGAFATATGTLSFSPSTLGQLTVSASFPGSPDLAPAHATVTLSVLPSDLTLAVRDSTLTLPTTHHTTTQITLVATGAMTDTVDLACPNAPFLVACTFTPVSTPVTGDGSAHTISVAVDTDFIHDWAHSQAPASTHTAAPVSLAAAGLPLLIAAFALFRRTRFCHQRPSPHALHPRHRLPNLLTLLLLALSVGALSSCSGLQPGHTPPGTYALTITAHARDHDLTRSAHLSLHITQ